MKVAEVILIFKQGSQMNCSNYRPISLLFSFNKIFEKILHKRVYTYLSKFKILPPNQFDFQCEVPTSHVTSACMKTCLTMQIKSIIVVAYFWSY